MRTKPHPYPTGYQDFFTKDSSVERFTRLIRTGELGLEWLEKNKFNPYFPKGRTCFTKFSQLSKDGIEDAQRIFAFGKGKDLPRNGLGLLSVSIVGSAASGLAGEFPYGYRKEIDTKGWWLKRDSTQAASSDIDIECVVNQDKIQPVAKTIFSWAQHLRNQNQLKTPPGKLSFILFPLEDIQKSLTGQRCPSAVTRYGGWADRIPLLGKVFLKELRKTAHCSIRNNPAIANFFWQNLADCWYLHQLKLRVKMGKEQEIFVPAPQIPTLVKEKKNQLRMVSCEIRFEV